MRWQISSCRRSVPAAVGKKAAKKCRLWLTGRGEQCILDSAMLSGGDVTIAERNNKPYFVALDGGAQTPILFDPCERNKIKILLRSRLIFEAFYMIYTRMLAFEPNPVE